MGPSSWAWSKSLNVSLGALGQPNLGQRNLRVTAFREAKQVEGLARPGPLEGLNMEGQHGYIFPSMYEEPGLYSNI